jgi:hypothetical protein
MKQEVLRIQMPRPVAEPRGAVFASSLVAWLRQFVTQQLAPRLAAAGRAVWRALEAEGQRRAERELRLYGSRAAADAAKVRELALRYDRVDPRFAAELRAAATRHEVLHGVE